MARTPPDWTKTGTVEGYAQYLCKQSNALCVVVIRPFNSVLAADLNLSPADCGKRLAEELPELVLKLHEARAEKKKAAGSLLDGVEHKAFPLISDPCSLTPASGASR